jgi:hypothetical protein
VSRAAHPMLAYHAPFAFWRLLLHTTPHFSHGVFCLRATPYFPLDSCFRATPHFALDVSCFMPRPVSLLTYPADNCRYVHLAKSHQKVHDVLSSAHDAGLIKVLDSNRDSGVSRDECVAYAHTYTHTHAHTHIYTSMRTHTCIHTGSHTHAHARAHTRAHTRARAIQFSTRILYLHGEHVAKLCDLLDFKETALLF